MLAEQLKQRLKSIGSNDSGYSGLSDEISSPVEGPVYRTINPLSADSPESPHHQRQQITTSTTAGLISDNNNISSSVTCGTGSSCGQTDKILPQQTTIENSANVINGNINSLCERTIPEYSVVMAARLPERGPTLFHSLEPDRHNNMKAKCTKNQIGSTAKTAGLSSGNDALPTGGAAPVDSTCPEAPVILINGDLEGSHRHHHHLNLRLPSDLSDPTQRQESIPTSGSSTTGDTITLPDRFRRKLPSPHCANCIANQRARTIQETRDNRLPKCENCLRNDSYSSGQDDSPERRAEDVTVAIQWLREQMLAMKAQDKVLMRQFLELRASIHGLSRGVVASGSLLPRSVTDLSPTGSSLSHPHLVEPLPCASMPRLTLDLHNSNYPIQSSGARVNNSALRGDECEVEFRARTVSAVTARPRSKLQAKAFSKEIV